MKQKRWTAFLLALLMLVQLTPLGALADAPEGYLRQTSNELRGNETYTVTFLMDDGKTIVTQLFDKDAGATVGSMPENPFKENSHFLRWEEEGTGVPVTADTVVNHDIRAVAVFETIVKYTVTVQYFYEREGQRHVFHTTVVELEKSGMPRHINSPTVTEDEQSGVKYYPTVPTLAVTENDIPANGTSINLEVKYVTHTAEYIFRHLLKDLQGGGYSEIENEDIEGVLGSTVTAQPKNYPYADFEQAETKKINKTGMNGEEKEILEVKYTRKSFTLTYNTHDGSYVPAQTAEYGVTLNLPQTNPVKTGYDFGGWYLDEGYGAPVSGNTLTLEKDTVLHAKWNPKQVNYTVVYQIENADDDHYSLLTTRQRFAQVGSSVTVNKNEAAPSELDGENFTFLDATTETVKADGSTVVTVRYSRNRYTITWDGWVGTLGYWSWSWAQHYDTLKLTAKYGANIIEQWKNTFKAYNPNYYWTYNRNSYPIAYFGTIDTMPAGDKVISACTVKNGKLFHLRYWLQNYAGSEIKYHNGKTYGLYKAHTVKGGRLTQAEEYPNMAGYNKGGYATEPANVNIWGDMSASEVTVHFFYDSALYQLKFYDTDGTFIKGYTLPLGEDIGAKMDAHIPAKPVFDAEWLGWFTDPAHATAYTGDHKMPTGLALYAAYRLPERTITFMDGGAQLAQKPIFGTKRPTK